MYYCPKCGSDTKTAHTDGPVRRRVCTVCNEHMTTIEVGYEDFKHLRKMMLVFKHIEKAVEECAL